MKNESNLKKGEGSKLNIFTLTILNIVAVVSLRGLPSEAGYGLTSIFFYLFAAIVFLIPVALISAELAAAFPEKGGVYRWVGEAFGSRVGFLAIWLQWIQNTIWFPTVLTFSAVSIAYIGINPSAGETSSLVNNKLYVAIVCLVLYWGATLINLRGLSASAKVSKYSGLIGTIIPAIILILFAVIWLILGKPLELNTNMSTLIPDFSNFNNLVLASSIFLFFAGMELSAVHVTEIENPQKNYPKAIILASIGTIVIFVLGTLAISFVLPADSINLTQGLLVTFDKYLTSYGLGFLSPVIAIMLVLGVLAGVLTWIGGPSKGLLAVGNHGLLPPYFQKINKNGVQVNILIIQGILVTLLILLFTFMPSVQAFYQILSQLTSILYLLMYLLVFLSGMVLRVKNPNQPRPFMVPGGKCGIFIIGGIAFIGGIMAMALSFLPPSQIEIGSKATWYGILVVGFIIFVGAPMIIYNMKKDSWINKESGEDIAPFTWEKSEGGK